MRTHYHLQERHLGEAVRRKLITEEQMEGILAIARSTAAAEGAPPDLGWVSVVQGLAAFTLLGAGAVYMFDGPDRANVTPWTVGCALAAITSLLAGLGLRRAGVARVAASLCVAGTAVFAWGVVAGLVTLAGAGRLDAATFDHETYETARRLRDLTHMAGFAGVAATAGLLWAATRVPTTVLPGAAAVATMLVGGAAQFMYDGRLSDRHAAPVLLVTALVVLGAARLLEHAQRGANDPAFWVHAVGLVPLGMAGAIWIDRAPEAVTLWVPAAGVVAWLGVRWDRKVYLAAAALALLGFPFIAAQSSHVRGYELLAVFATTVFALGVGATLLRRMYLRRWAARGATAVDRTVW